MRTTLFALVAVLISQSTFATEPDCVRVYRLASADYFLKIDGLNDEVVNLTGGTILAAAAWTACVVKSRSAIACSAMFGAIGGTAYLTLRSTNDEIQQREDAHSLYELYFSVQSGYPSESPETQEILKAGDIAPDNQQSALTEISRMMESGELCKDGKPAFSVADLQENIRAKILKKNLR